MSEAKNSQRTNGMQFKLLKIVFVNVLVLSLAIIFIWPFLSILGWSLNEIDVYTNPLSPIPKAFSLKLYELSFTKYSLGSYLLNTIKVSVIATILGTVSASMAGYALAKLKFRGRNFLFLLVIIMMLLPMTTVIAAKYEVVRNLRLLDSHWGLILPSAGGSAMSIFLMRQYMLRMPTEMLEAGRIDGCSELGLFFRLVLPNMKAPFFVLATISLAAQWNELMWPIIVISTDSKQVIMPAIARLSQGITGSDPYAIPAMTASALLVALVPLALYAYSQRHFVETMGGSLKG